LEHTYSFLLYPPGCVNVAKLVTRSGNGMHWKDKWNLCSFI